MPRNILATLSGPDLCEAEGHIVRHPISPALALCRALINVGYEADRPMLVFRNGELAIRLKSIGWAAEFGPLEYGYRWSNPRKIQGTGVRAKRRRPRRAANDPRLIQPAG